MRPDLRRRLHRYARGGLLSTLLGLALGYVTFFVVFPTVTIPAAGEPPIWTLLGLLLGVALLVGLATQDPAAAMVQAFLALPLGLIVASAMAFSPALSGLTLVRPEEIFFFLLRFGFIPLLLSLPVNIFGILVGLWAWERFGSRPASPTVRRVEANRKV